jgi:anti-sigma B factor antagonist
MATDAQPTERGQDQTVKEQKDAAHLDCRLERRQHAVVVSVTGAIDITTQATFAQAVQEAWQQDKPLVVIDLAGVTFMASPGLAVLVEAQETAMRLRKDLHVAIGSEVVRRSIELTGLAQILSLTSDVRTALGERLPEN